MITLSKLNIYKRLAGNVDAWARAGESDEDFSDAEWAALDSLLQRLTLCSRGLAADSFRVSAYHDLDQIAADSQVRSAILELVT